jgi:hypothetical protein
MRPLSRSSKKEKAVKMTFEAIRPCRESTRGWTGPAPAAQKPLFLHTE